MHAPHISQNYMFVLLLFRRAGVNRAACTDGAAASPDDCSTGGATCWVRTGTGNEFSGVDGSVVFTVWVSAVATAECTSGTFTRTDLHASQLCWGRWVVDTVVCGQWSVIALCQLNESKFWSADFLYPSCFARLPYLHGIVIQPSILARLCICLY